MINLFETTSYKTLIKNKMSQLKLVNSKYTFDSLAKTMNVHKPYLSRVLNQKGDFNSDQLFLCANYLKLTELEKKFLFLLFEENNCFVNERKSLLQSEIEKIRKKALKSESLYNSDPTTDPISIHRTTEYYLDPFYALIHMFLISSKYNENPSLVANKLGLSIEKTNEYIETLHDMKIIEKKQNKITVLKEFLHLPESSSLITAFRNLSKLKSLERISSTSNDNYLSLHVFFTSDETARKKIQKLFLEFLDEAKKISDKSKSEEVYQLNFDLLKWS